MFVTVPKPLDVAGLAVVLAILGPNASPKFPTPSREAAQAFNSLTPPCDDAACRSCAIRRKWAEPAPKSVAA